MDALDSPARQSGRDQDVCAAHFLDIKAVLYPETTASLGGPFCLAGMTPAGSTSNTSAMPTGQTRRR